MLLLVYSPVLTNRLRYTWEVLFNYILRLDFSLTADADFYRQADAYKINYSKKRLLEAEVFIPCGNLLLESDIRTQSIQVFQHDGLPAFFRQEAADADFPFDVPALVFYLISRYEEYLPFEPDAHGRFEAQECLAFQHHFLRQPLVNEWALRLCAILQAKFPPFQFQISNFKFDSTYDLDLAWAYLHRGWQRNLGAYARDLLKGDFKNMCRRRQVKTKQIADPFFTFDYLKELNAQYNLQPYFFILLGDHGAFDKNIDPKNPAFRELIQQLQQHYQLGIHPSYQSNEKAGLLKKEIQRLEAITGNPVVRSRQHFLKLRFPQTYQQLLDLNITADYSLGYASDVGFRASVSDSYPWYDLSKEEMTPLLLHPFQVMDVTLKEYLKLDPPEALELVQSIMGKIRLVGGTFCTLWHNSSFSELDDWEAWRKVYEEIIRFAVRN